MAAEARFRAGILQQVRRLLRPLEHTPLHPQWLVRGHRAAVRQLVLRHGRGLLLDVGCGDAGLRALVKSPVRYLGLDYPVTRALGYAGKADILGDAASLPLADASVNTMCLIDVLEHLATPGAALEEAARVLAPGGVLLVHVPFLYPVHDAPHDYRRWTEHGLSLALSARGFAITHLEADCRPLPSAAALFAIALADAVASAVARPGPRLLLAPVALALIPVVNLLGFILGSLLPGSRFLTYGYLLVARAAAAGVDTDSAAVCGRLKPP